MFTETNYTDPQGNNHALVVFEVANVNFAESINKTMYQDVTQGVAARTVIENNNANISFDYRIYFWTSQANYDNNNMPYILMTNNPMGETIHADINGLPGYEGLTLIEQAEKHFKEVFLA